MRIRNERAFCLWAAAAIAIVAISMLGHRPNQREAGYRLVTAACNDDVDLLRSALAAGAPGAGALHVAAMLGHERIVTELLRGGVDPNARSISGRTPLMAAAGSPNSVAVARLLIAAGADPTAADQQGRTPMTDAIESDDISLIELLKAHEATMRTGPNTPQSN